MKKSNAKIRIVPIFLIIAVLLSLTISSELNKEININLEFSNSTNYDLDDDGIETTKGVVDLTVENTEFNWNVNQEKLLTKWTITDEDTLTTTNICYGNEQGCAFIDLVTSSKNWNDIFYVNYGKDGAGYNNIVSSKIIYYDVNVSNNLVEIYNSKQAEKQVKFYDDVSNDLSNLNVVVKDKQKREIGHHQIIEDNGDYNLIISNKKSTLGLRTISTSATQQTTQKPESKVKINKIRKIEDIEAIIDYSSEKEITTDIIAINSYILEFENAEITLAKQGDVSVIMRCENFDFENSVCEDWQPTNIQFTDEGDVIRFNVTGFSAYGGSNITILNVHSYPPLYGNWIVRFNTTGKADLTIRAVNGTTWTNIYDVGSGYDLKFLEIKCGDEILNYEWVNDTVFIQDYSCHELSYETQKELTTGAHYLEFTFGTQTVYALNNVYGPIVFNQSPRVRLGRNILANASHPIGGNSHNCSWFTQAGGDGGECSIVGTTFKCNNTVIKGDTIGTCIVRVENLTNSSNYTQTTLEIFEIPRLITLIINSSDTNTSRADPDDTVVINFTSNIDLANTPAVIIDGKAADSVNNISNYSTWTASRVMQNGDSAGKIAFTIDIISTKGDPGAQQYTEIHVNGSGYVWFYPPSGGTPYVRITSTVSRVEKGNTLTVTAEPEGNCSEWKNISSTNSCGISYSGCTATVTGVNVGNCEIRVYYNATIYDHAMITVYDNTKPENDMVVTASDVLRDQWEGGIRVSWTASSSDDVVNYTIWRTTDEATGTGDLVNYTNSKDILEFFDLNTSNNTNIPYFYKVVACDNAGNCNDGVWSSAVSINALPIQNNVTIEHLDQNNAEEIEDTYTNPIAIGPINSSYYDTCDGENFTKASNYTIHSTICGVDEEKTCRDTFQNATGNFSRNIICNVALVNTTTSTDLKCVGIAYDKDLEQVSMIYNITILETYSRGVTNYLKGVTNNCIYMDEDEFGWQNKYDLPAGTTYCTVDIPSSYTSKGDKIKCEMKPDDGKEKGDSLQSGTTYVRNTAPFAYGVYITPSSPNESSTLTCNYTFIDTDDGDEEDTDAALFKWYINNEGLNPDLFIKIGDQTERTLSNILDVNGDVINWTFDKDDIVICSVKVKDIDDGWLNEPFYDDNYVNVSSPVVIIDNAKPQIIDFSDTSNYTNPTTLYDDVQFDITWVDYEDDPETAQMFVCDSITSQETGYDKGKDNFTIGNGISITYYTNITGGYVDIIAIKPFNFTNASGDSFTSGFTNYVYDIYAFEVDKVGDAIPAYEPLNVSTWPIAEDHDNAFVMDKDNYIRLQYNSHPLPNKRLAIIFCVDDNDIDTDYCTALSGNNSESIYIKADEVNSSPNYNINSSNGKEYTNASIKINYKSTTNGTVSDVGCIENEYCHTDLSSDNTISCSYTTQQTDDIKSNPYYVKACDDMKACSVYRQGTFWVNHKAEMDWVNLTSTNRTGKGFDDFADDENLNCTYQNKTDLWVKDDGNLTFTFKWYVDRTGSFVLYDPNLPSDTNVLNNVHTNEGDQWRCEVTPNDGFIDGIPKSSSPVYIGASSDEGNQKGIPYITTVVDNSNWTNPTTVGENITFQIAWGDSNSSQIYAFVCNSTGVGYMGCSDPPLGWSGPGTTSDNPVNVTFAVDEDWGKLNKTVHIYIFDDDWINSSVYKENFSVNIKPEMAWVNLTTTNNSEIIMNDKNLKCTHANQIIINDSWIKNNGNLSFTFKWYYNRTGSFVLHSSTEQILAKTATNEGEQWICEVTPNDGFVNGTPMNSSIRTIGQGGIINQDGIPEIISIIDNSNDTNPTLNGSSITFEITWGDSNSQYLNMVLICNSTNVTSSGCLDYEFGRLDAAVVGPISDHVVYISFTANESDDAYVFLYDDTNTKSVNDSYYENFTINYPPEMAWVNLTTTDGNTTIMTEDNLNCTHNASDDGVNNGSDPAITYTYRWFLDRTGTFAYYSTHSTQRIISNGATQEGDKWICEVTPNDGFVDGTPMNSSPRTIGGIEIPADGIPRILNVVDNSNLTNPTTAGSMITFEIEWGDSNSGTLIALYICNTTNVETTGCLDYEFARAGPTSANPVLISFTANENWGTNQSAYIYIYDDTWINSSAYNENFTINYPPVMAWVNLTTTDGNTTIMDDDNLNCTHQNESDILIKNDSAHNNATTLTFTYKWYYDTGGGFVLHSSTEQTISQWDTNEGDKWKCEVTPNDGFIDGTPMNSTPIRTIGSTQTQLEGIPEITNVIDNSDYTNPTTAGSSITFEIYWADTNSSTLSRIYICNSSSVLTSGCVDYEFGRAGPTSINPVYITFTANENWGTNQSTYIYIYDDVWLNSSVYKENFSINHRPNATVTVEYISASSLQCYVQNFNDTDGDTENTSLREFKWWENDVLQSTTSENLTYVSIPDNTFKCAVRVYDVRGLSSADYIASDGGADFYGTDTIIAPFVWTLPEAVASLSINIIGYINKSNNNLNVTAIALQGYNSPFTSSTRNLTSNSTFIGSTISENNFAAGNAYIAIYESAIGYFTIGNYLEFQNHNKTYFTRYNITDTTNLFDGRYRIDISPNLEADVTKLTEEIYVYNSSKPTGWFNFSLQLFQGDNEIRVRGYENVSNNTVLTGMSTIFNIYYDNQSPYINTSSIQLSSNNNIHTIDFQITDDFKINLSTLFINITNTTYNVTHRYDSLVYDNESWNWGNNITCSGNNTIQDCNVTLNLEDGNYTMTFSVNDSVNNQNITTRTTYLIDSTKPSAPTVYNKARQNSTNLSVLWKSPSSNMISAQYAVGNKTHRYPAAGWDSVISWTNTSENLSHKIIDSNNNNYLDKNETIIESADYNLSSNDVVNKTGYAALKNFLNGTEMFNDNNTNGVFDSIDWIINDTNGNGIFDNITDSILYGNSSLPNGSSLLNFSTNIVYSDENYDNNYDIGEAIINDTNENSQLDQGGLDGSGTDQVIVDGTADMFIPLTTINLSLINHEFYYVYVRYKNNENLFYSLVGSSLVIKYSTTTGGITEEQENYTGPSAVSVYAPVESSIRTFTANWTESIDDRYNISYYQYSIGTAKYPATGWDSTVSWTNNSLNRTASYASTEYTDGVYYYWNVRAINAIDNISDVNSSEGTLFHDQIPPIVTLLQVANDTNGSDGWLDNLNDNSTAIKVQGDENMTCFISPYDKWYSDYNPADDVVCAPTNSVNVTCNLTDTNVAEVNNFTYHIVCRDNLGIPNGHNKTQNLDITFLVDWPTSPEVRNLTIWIYYANMTLRGKAQNLSNTTYTNEILECNGTYYDQDGDNFTSEAWSWTNNGAIIANANTSQLNLSINGSKGDNITCFYNVTDSTNMNSTTYNYTVYINNTKPTVETPIINSSALQNRTNESLSCYVQSASDEDNDTINYTYKWYKNNALNTTTDNTNISYDVLGFGNTSKGENWTCGVIPYDGEENGTAVNSTQLTIINTGPLFSTTINNISWDKNTDYSFDLDNYFSDIDNDNLTYNYTDATNINVTINQTTGFVTLTPYINFIGINSIRFNATDGEYWSNYSNTVTLNITNSTINVTLNSPVDNYNSSNTLITFNCSANIISGNNNLTNITLNIWNSTWLYNTTTNTTINTNSTNVKFNVTITPDGDYTWNCQACDNESECTSAQNNYQFTIDTTYPIIVFSSGTENNFTNVSRTWIYVDVNVTELNEKNTSFILYNDTSGLILNQTNYTTSQRSINWTGLSDGNYSYNVTVCDSVDYCNSTGKRLIVLDTIPPNKVTGLINLTVNSSFVTLNWTATSDNGSGVREYIIYRNNTNIANTTLTQYNDSNVNSSSSYLYNVSAVDYAGNEGNADGVIVNTSADLTAPVISNVANSSITTSSATITWTTDDYANSTVYYGTNGSSLNQNTSSSTLTKSHSISLSGLSSSTTYYYQVNSSNREGLSTNSSIYSFTTSSIGGVSTPPGGGGGGGTPTTTATSIKVGSSFISYALEENDMLEFTLDGETHTIKMDEIEEDYVILIVSSIPQTIKISLGETKKIDVNYDTKYDLEIKLISIVNSIRSKQATILIKGAEAPEPLGVLQLPRKEEVKKAPPKPAPKPKVEEYAPPEKEGINILTYAISAFITIALIGSLVMKERMRINYMNNQPELKLQGFIKKAKTKGYKIDDIRKVLVSKGWPSHIVDSAALNDPISYLLKKGHNHTMVREVLKSKGFSSRIIDNAILQNHITKELKKRRGLKSIRKELLKAGWDKKTIDKKLSAK